MKLLLFTNTVLLFLNSLCSLYLWILAFFGIRTRKPPSSQKYNRFAIIVPAHNEENSIDTLIKSLRDLDYPKDLYDCYFGADHCTDRTVERIGDGGLICYEKKDGLPGKGRVLSWLTKIILEEYSGRYDAVVYFDADDQADSNFLKVINASLNAGNEIIQGNSKVLNWDDSIFTIINHINVATSNRLKENARTNAGLSCYLHGHGMCFKINVLRESEWAHNSLVEDEELFLRLILAGKKVTWEHMAVVNNKIPSGMKSSEHQRLRWSRGRIKLLKEKGLIMLKNFIKDLDWASFDVLLVLSMPTHSILVGLSIIIWIVSFVFLQYTYLMFAWSTILLLSYLFYFFLGAILEKIPVRTFFYGFLSPIFIFWRIWVYLISLMTLNIQKWR